MEMNQQHMNADAVRAYVAAMWPEAMHSPLAVAMREVAQSCEHPEFLREVREAAFDLAYIHRAMPKDDRWECVDAHIESEFGARDEYAECADAIARIVSEAVPA